MKPGLANGNALRDAGDLDGALAAYLGVPAASPQFPAARLHAAKILADRGRHSEIVDLTAEVDVAAMHPPLALARARALRAVGDTEGLLSFVEAHIRHHTPSGPMVELAVDAAGVAAKWDRALQLLDLAIAGSDETRFRFRRATTLFNMDRDDEALKLTLEVARDPDFFLRANMFLVKVYQRLEDNERMAASCEAVLEVEPDNQAAHEALIKLYIDADDLSSARKAFDRAAAAKPDLFPAAIFEFLTLDRVGRRRKGLRPFEDAAIRSGLSTDLKARIGNAFYISGKLGYARTYANLLGDDDRGQLLKARIALASGKPIDVDKLPAGRDGDLARALYCYINGENRECVAILENMDVEPQVRMAVNNFRDLAISGASLSPQLYASAASSPRNTDQNLPVINQLWVGNPLSYIERLSIRSFLACGHQVHLYTYDPGMDVPTGCEIRDAGEILPESEIFVHSAKAGRSKGSFAGFADRFRWKLIYEKGGAWADADVICLQPINSTRIISTELMQLRGQILPAVTNCFFAFEARDPLLRETFEQVSVADNSLLRWGEIGIHKMADLVARNKWSDRLAAPTDICPIPPFQMVDAIAGGIDVEEVIEETGCRAIHLYNEVMRTASIDKNGSFPPNSVITALERKVSQNERKR